MLNRILTWIYAHTACKDYGNCIGLCGKKFTKEEIQKAVEESWL